MSFCGEGFQRVGIVILHAGTFITLYADNDATPPPSSKLWGKTGSCSDFADHGSSINGTANGIVERRIARVLPIRASSSEVIEWL
jgi:hypothetical protein